MLPNYQSIERSELTPTPKTAQKKRWSPKHLLLLAAALGFSFAFFALSNSLAEENHGHSSHTRSLAETSSNEYCQEWATGSATTLTAANQVLNATVTRRMEVAFELKVNSLSAASRSVLRVGENNNDRQPGIFLRKNEVSELRVVFKSAHNTGSSQYIDVPISVGTWHSLRIQVREYDAAVFLDGALVEKLWLYWTRREFRALVPVYAGDPKFDPADALIRNLRVCELSTEQWLAPWEAECKRWDGESGGELFALPVADRMLFYFSMKHDRWMTDTEAMDAEVQPLFHVGSESSPSSEDSWPRVDLHLKWQQKENFMPNVYPYLEASFGETLAWSVLAEDDLRHKAEFLADAENGLLLEASRDGIEQPEEPNGVLVADLATPAPLASERSLFLHEKDFFSKLTACAMGSGCQAWLNEGGDAVSSGNKVLTIEGHYHLQLRFALTLSSADLQSEWSTVVHLGEDADERWPLVEARRSGSEAQLRFSVLHYRGDSDLVTETASAVPLDAEVRVSARFMGEELDLAVDRAQDGSSVFAKQGVAVAEVVYRGLPVWVGSSYFGAVASGAVVRDLTACAEQHCGFWQNYARDACEMGRQVMQTPAGHTMTVSFKLTLNSVDGQYNSILRIGADGASTYALHVYLRNLSRAQIYFRVKESNDKKKLVDVAVGEEHEFEVRYYGATASITMDGEYIGAISDLTRSYTSDLLPVFVSGNVWNRPAKAVVSELNICVS